MRMKNYQQIENRENNGDFGFNVGGVLKDFDPSFNERKQQHKIELIGIGKPEVEKFTPIEKEVKNQNLKRAFIGKRVIPGKMINTEMAKDRTFNLPIFSLPVETELRNKILTFRQGRKLEIKAKSYFLKFILCYFCRHHKTDYLKGKTILKKILDIHEIVHQRLDLEKIKSVVFDDESEFQIFDLTQIPNINNYEEGKTNLFGRKYINNQLLNSYKDLKIKGNERILGLLGNKTKVFLDNLTN